MRSSNLFSRLSRRKFMGTITGAAALALIEKDRHALAGTNPSNELIADYVGRLCYNENPLGPAPSAIAAIHNEAEMVHRYPDWYAESLVSRIADLYDVPSNQVVCGAGATEILRLCAMAFTQPGGNIVAPYPSYSQFPSDAQFFGSSVRYADLDSNYRINLQAMLDEVDSNTTCVCITNPNNPTGTLLSVSELFDFVDSLPSEVVILIDEAYFKFISLITHPGGYEEEKYLSAVEMVRNDKNVVVLRTFSKVYGLAGARIGFAIGKSSAINAIKSYRIYASISRPSLEAAKAALYDETHITNTVIQTRTGMNYCFEEFQLMGLDYIPSETNFFMVDVDDGSYVRSQLAAHGIYVRDGWGMPSHIRVSIGTYQEMQDFISALQEILSGVRHGKRTNRALPAHTELYPVYPNPFNSSTSIKIYIPDYRKTNLEIFDIHGRLVKKLADGILLSGEHSFFWNGTNMSGRSVASGSYFYRLKAGDDVITKRMILVK